MRSLLKRKTLQIDQYRRVPNTTYQIVPYMDSDQTFEESKYKQIITQLVNLNKSYLSKGAGRLRKSKNKQTVEYLDVPNVSYQMMKKGGNVYQYITLMKKDEVLRESIQQAIFNDMKGCKFTAAELNLPGQHLHAFTIRGEHHLSIHLDKQFDWVKTLFKWIGQDERLLYSLTVKEAENHEMMRQKLSQKQNGTDNWKAIMKEKTKVISKTMWEMSKDQLFEKETLEKINHAKERIQQIKSHWKKKEEPKQHSFSERKVMSESNSYLYVQPYFIYWAENEKKVAEFQQLLQKIMDEIQGDNRLKVVSIQPNLELIQQGYINYDHPQLCFYQKELEQFLYLPTIEDIQKDGLFYFEKKMKTEIPQEMYRGEPGALAFARDLNTNQIIYFPEAKTEEEKDVAVKAIALVGEQGGGKTTAAVNQVVETFYLKAKNREEWKKYAHSTIVFDIADGEMHTDILRHVPDWLMDRVIILNHANLRYPIPTNLHDLAKETYDVSALAEDECDMLMDCLDDKSTTIAVERYFKNAMKASYEVGEGGLLDAMRILTNEEYRLDIIRRLYPKKKELYIEMIQIHKKLIRDEKVVETIENRTTIYRTNRTLMYSIAQPPNEKIDFYKWMNGDQDGPYLVLIYIPSEKAIGKSTRKFLFTHYFYKIWKMMYGRESINKPERPETLIVVDELHQILDQRVVKDIFPKIFKEPRKYRLRYLFTFHGWSSIEEAGQKKESIIQSMMDSGCNIFFYKGGVDFFNSMKRLAEPYTWKDFSEIQKMKYCGLFRVSHNKESHVFPARFLEPAVDRLEKYREISLSEFHRYQSPFSCVAEFAQQHMDAKLEETYQQLIKEFEEEEKERQREREEEERACQNQSESLEEELATISRGSEF